MSCGDPRITGTAATTTTQIIATCDGTNYITLPWPHSVSPGDTILAGNTAYTVTSTSGGTVASTPYHGYPGYPGFSGAGGIAGSQLQIYGPGSSPQWHQPEVDVSQFLPDKEAHEFLSQLLKNHCSNNDAKEMLLMLFDKISTTEKEDIKISPEVVTSLLSFCIEKYA